MKSGHRHGQPTEIELPARVGALGFQQQHTNLPVRLEPRVVFLCGLRNPREVHVVGVVGELHASRDPVRRRPQRCLLTGLARTLGERLNGGDHLERQARIDQICQRDGGVFDDVVQHPRHPFMRIVQAEQDAQRVQDVGLTSLVELTRVGVCGDGDGAFEHGDVLVVEANATALASVTEGSDTSRVPIDASSAAVFVDVDWDAPLDVDAQVQAIPLDRVIKGMSFNAVLDAVARQGREPLAMRRAPGFKDLPMRDFLALLVTAQRTAYPDMPPRRALRAIGHDHFRGLLDTMIFRVIFAGIGNAFGVERALRLAPRAYNVPAKHERVSILEVEEGHMVLSYDDVWAFPDCFHIGIVEGALEVLGAVTDGVRVRRRGVAAVDLEFRWSRAR